MDVAGYIRVSTQQQKEEGSHENQEERLKEWADRNDHDLTLYRDIAISGQSDERERYHELMGSAGQYDAIVVRELSRFGRSLQQVLNDIDQLDEDGADFISLEDNFDTSTAQGTLLFQIIGAFNEFWANLARERAQEEVERRREEGEPLGRPKKLTDEQIEEVREWHEKGLAYSSIATLIEDAYDVSVSRQTIYRYCN
jgi:DNA invertase Pin-like site-specific DNA recombinase